MNFIDSTNSSLLKGLLDASALRARVIAGNVANQNTPGYQRKVVRFEELLRDAAAKGKSPAEMSAIAVQVDEDSITPARADGNNVNLELEMSAMRQNRLLYEMYSIIHASRSNLIQSAIEGR